MDVAGKTVVVTGAANGIGAELARQLAGKGARVALLDVQTEALERVASQIGGIDVVVSNAGLQRTGSVAGVAPDEFDRVIEVNLLGAWRTTRATLAHLVRSKGYLLFVSSLSGTVFGPLQASYNASKAGINAFAASLRLEVEGAGVSVGVAHLSYTDTATGRGAVEHPAMQRLPGMPSSKPIPVERTSAALLGAIEARAKRVVIPGWGRVLLAMPSLVQRSIEGRARRRHWAATIAADET